MATENEVRALAKTLRQKQVTLHDIRQQQKSLLSIQELIELTVEDLTARIDQTGSSAWSRSSSQT